MKKIILMAFFALLVNVHIHSQSNLVVSGTNGNGSGGNFSASVGQIDYISASGSGGSINQGNQQAFEIFENSLAENYLIEVSIFPNPTSDFLLLKIIEPQVYNFKYQLIDGSGKLIETSNIEKVEQEINFKNLRRGQYLLNLLVDQKIIKSYKIIKN